MKEMFCTKCSLYSSKRVRFVLLHVPDLRTHSKALEFTKVTSIYHPKVAAKAERRVKDIASGKSKIPRLFCDANYVGSVGCATGKEEERMPQSLSNR